MREAERIAESLHSLERQVLPVLSDGMSVQNILEATSLKEVEVMNALNWLSNKKLVKVDVHESEVVSVGVNGEVYKEKGFPERRFLQVLEKPLPLRVVQERAGLDKDELSVSLGVLKKSGAIELGEEVRITEKGMGVLSRENEEEMVLKKLPLSVSELSAREKKLVEELRKRKDIVRVEVKKVRVVHLTELGGAVRDVKSSEKLIDALTPQVLQSGSWRGKKLRRYDVEVGVPRMYPAKRHFVNQAVEYIKQVWLEMGFKEMEGGFVQPAFWNFDALFTPQDHPAREMQDTFFVKGKAKLLKDKGLVARVKKEHECGWKSAWSEEKARELVLRTHTTVLSALQLYKLSLSDLPAKFFSVARVFRNEAVDWSHLFELTQVEGIVVDPNANFRHLIGYLKQFYRKLGFERVRVRPGYFPYVEPGLEVEVFHPVRKQWVELGGAGILRPEVVKPLLGKDVPVLAWGQGLERGITEYYNIKDIREMYVNDLKQVRSMKVWGV